MKTLVLCRHAKSDWPSGVDDMDRPLKERGTNDAIRLSQLLSSHGFVPDAIISSPANRALSTAKIISEQLNYDRDITVERNVYFGGTGELISIIQDLPTHLNSVMVFGHNPTMEQSVRYLLQLDSPFEMPTCGMVCMESVATHWQDLLKHHVMLRWYLIPRLKRKSI